MVRRGVELQAGVLWPAVRLECGHAAAAGQVGQALLVYNLLLQLPAVVDRVHVSRPVPAGGRGLPPGPGVGSHHPAPEPLLQLLVAPLDPRQRVVIQYGVDGARPRHRTGARGPVRAAQ